MTIYEQQDESLSQAITSTMPSGMEFGDRHQHINHLRPSMSQGSQHGRFEDNYMNSNMNINFPFNYQNQGAMNRQYSYGSSMGDQFNLLNQISVSSPDLILRTLRILQQSDCLFMLDSEIFFAPVFYILCQYSNTRITQHSLFPATKQVQNISHHLIQIFSWLVNYLKYLHQVIHPQPTCPTFTMMPCFPITTGRPGTPMP